MPESNDAEQIIRAALDAHSRGQLHEAELGYRRGLSLNPNHVLALHYLGVIAHQTGNHPAAIELMQRSIAIEPGVSAFHNNLGEAYRASNQLDAAEREFTRAIEIDPKDYLAHNNLGVVAQRKKQYEKARNHFERAIAITPQFTAARCNLATTYMLEHNFLEAEGEYRLVLRASPNDAMALKGLAGLIAPLGRVDEAIKAIDHAVKVSPNDPDAHITRMEVLVLAGRMREAWKEYEWRMQKYPVLQQKLPQPRWRGEPIEGKTILLYEEQGYGDTLMFCRYVPLVAKRAARVILYCRPELKALMESLEGSPTVVTKGHEEFDVHSALESLPEISRTDVATIPASIPYLAASTEAVDRWRERFAEFEGKRRIGLAWAASAADRSAMLSQLAPLADVDAVFISLQKGDAAKELQNPPTGMRIINVSQHLTDFNETAAAMMNCDLIITVDTAAAHLAGALGRPTWTMLPMLPTWRWLLGREDSAWYPTMKLWRQKVAGDFHEVATRMAAKLKAD